MPPFGISILLVDDSPWDVRFFQETLRDCRMQNDLHVVTDGDEALAFLRKQGPWAGAPSPDLILLDLHLPKVDGSEVIRQMQLDAALKDIPVVMLIAPDRAPSGQPAAVRFAAKPLTPECLLSAIRDIPNLGLTIVRVASAQS